MISNLLTRLRLWDQRAPEFKPLLQWSKAHRSWFLYLLTFSIVAFGYELFQYNLSMDEEMLADRWGAQVGWVEQSRWGMYLLGFVFPKTVVPVIPLFIALLFSSLAIMLAFRTVSQKASPADYFVAPLALTCPTLYFAYHFSTLNFGVGIGFFVSSLGLYIYSRKRRGYQVLCLAASCVAIGIYQAMAGYILVLYGFHFINRILVDEISGQEALQELKRFGLIFLGSLISYYLVSRLFMGFLGVQSDGYIARFLKVTLTRDYFITTFQMTIGQIRKFYSGHPHVYFSWIRPLKILALFSVFAVLCRILCSNNSKRVKLLAVVVLISTPAIPFLLHLVNAGGMPVRSTLGFPLAVALMVYLASQIPSRVVHLSLYGLSLLCCIHFSTINNLLSLSETLVGRADRRLASRVRERIDTHPSGKKVKRIELVGAWKWPKSPLFIGVETVGASFFEWDGGDARRVVRFMSTMGLHGIKAAPIWLRRRLINSAQKMPNWPHRESIRIVNGVAILKVGDYTNTQLHQLCDNAKKPHDICFQRGILPNPSMKVSGHSWPTNPSFN